jgi:hypothetical protein
MVRRAVLTRATRRNIPESASLHSHRRENLKLSPSVFCYIWTKNTTKQTPWPLVHERTIPTDRPPLVDEI